MSRHLFLSEKLVEIKSPLGSGAYGRVLLAVPRNEQKKESGSRGESGQRFAVKANLVDRRTNFIGCVREIDMLVRTAHLGTTVQILGVLSDAVDVKQSPYRPDDVLLLLECGDCSLTHWIEGKPSGAARVAVAAQVLAAVAHLHRLRIIHRDIKPCNVLCFGTTNEVQLKLCDFGMARVWAPHDKQSTQIMTPEYRPPEIASEKTYNVRADCWSVGAVLYEVLLGRYLLQTEGENTKRTNAWLIEEHKKLPKTRKAWEKHLQAESIDVAAELSAVNPDWSRHVADLLCGLLANAPSKRYNCAQCLFNPLFASYADLQAQARELQQALPLVDEYEVPSSERRSAFITLLLSAHDALDGESWYGCRALFCALSIFDRIEALLESPPAHPREWAVAALYLALKYHSDSQGLAYNELFSDDVCTPAFIERVGKYEILILSDFLNFSIHTDTLFDHAALLGDPHPHTRILIQDLAALAPGKHSLSTLAQKNALLLKSRKNH